MYYNTFITVAEDSKATESKMPAPRGSKPTVAQLQYQMLIDEPGVHTMEDVLFGVWLERQELDGMAEDEVATMRAEFFSKGQPCLRTSPLAKTHGFGFAFDDDGRVTMVPMESDAYTELAAQEEIAQLKAMRSKRA